MEENFLLHEKLLGSVNVACEEAVDLRSCQVTKLQRENMALRQELKDNIRDVSNDQKLSEMKIQIEAQLSELQRLRQENTELASIVSANKRREESYQKKM